MHFIKRCRSRVIATIAIFLTLVCYSISSPIGAGADMDFHLANIWCGWGETPGLCEDQGLKNNTPSAEVPFMFQICDGRPIDSYPACDFDTTHPATQYLRTQSGPDQNLYYKIMRVFASENPINSVIQIRIFNSLLASLIFLLALTLSTKRIRFAGVAAITFTLIPNVLQNVASANPRSWSILSVLTSWIFLFSYLESRHENISIQRSRLVAYLLVLFLAIATRIDASIMVITTSILVFLFCRFKPTLPKLKTSFFVLMFMTSLIFILQLFPRISALFSFRIPNSVGLLQFSIFEIIHIPEFVADWWGYRVGQSGSGPGIVGIIGLFLFTANMAFALQKSDGKQRVIFFINSFIVFGMLTKSTIALGGIVPAPGIYSLGLAAPWLGVTIASSKSGFQFMSSIGNRKFAIGLLSFAHAISFYSWIEFYTRRGKGLGFYESLSLSESWWWNVWFSPNAVFVAGTILFPVFLTYAWKSTPLELSE